MLSTKSRTELKWWIENLRLTNVWTFSQLNSPDDYSNRCFPDWVGSSLKRSSNILSRRGREKLVHNCAGTTSNKIGSIFLDQRERGLALLHFQPYLTFWNWREQKYVQIKQEIWHYLQNGNMSITAQYLP